MNRNNPLRQRSAGRVRVALVVSACMGLLLALSPPSAASSGADRPVRQSGDQHFPSEIDVPGDAASLRSQMAPRAHLNASEIREAVAQANRDLTSRKGPYPGKGDWVTEDQLSFFRVNGDTMVTARNSLVLRNGTIVPDPAVADETSDSLVVNFGWWSVYRPRQELIWFSAETVNAYNYSARWESFSTYVDHAVTTNTGCSAEGRIKSWWSLIPLAETYEQARYGSAGSQWDYAVGTVESGMEMRHRDCSAIVAGYKWAQQGVRSSNPNAEFTGVSPRSSFSGQNCSVRTVETGVSLGGGAFITGSASSSVSTTTESCEKTSVAGTTSQRGWFTMTYRPNSTLQHDARELVQGIGLRWPEGTFWGPQIGHGIDACAQTSPVVSC